MLLKNLSPYKIKTVATNFYLKSYYELILSCKNIASYMTLFNNLCINFKRNDFSY